MSLKVRILAACTDTKCNKKYMVKILHILNSTNYFIVQFSERTDQCYSDN